MGKVVAKAGEWKVRAKLPGLQYSVQAVAFSHDGKLLASGSHGGEAWLSDAKSGKPLHKFGGYDTVSNFAFSRDGKLLAVAGADEATNVYDLKTGRILATLEGESNHVSFSPDGNLLAAAMGKSPRVWDAKTWTQVAKLDGHRTGVIFVEFLAGGRLASCAGKEARVWDVGAGRSIAFDHKGDTNYLCASADGRYLVTAGYKRHARVWDVDAKKQAAELAGHDEEVWSAAIARDGSIVVTGSGEGAVRVWQMPDGELGHEFRSEAEEAADECGPVALSPDGKLVAAQMGTVRVWEATSGKALAKLSAKAEMSCLAFSPDGKVLVAGSRHGVVLYEVPGKVK